ncbi:MAG: hypothetical protein ACYCUI_14565 [Vulcanimicrobiaceae bacterium]
MQLVESTENVQIRVDDVYLEANLQSNWSSPFIPEAYIYYETKEHLNQKLGLAFILIGLALVDVLPLPLVPFPAQYQAYDWCVATSVTSS